MQLISLVGMPGGGKSTIGRHLAHRLSWPFFDSDAAIEKQTGRSIKEFFDREGEVKFREVEAQCLAALITVASSPSVIATGGGAILIEGNRQLLRERTTCLYLRSSPEELFRRLRHDTKRPLLQVADPLHRLRELHLRRDTLYNAAAHFVFDTGRPSLHSLVNIILMQLELAGVVDRPPLEAGSNVAPDTPSIGVTGSS